MWLGSVCVSRAGMRKDRIAKAAEAGFFQRAPEGRDNWQPQLVAQPLTAHGVCLLLYLHLARRAGSHYTGFFRLMRRHRQGTVRKSNAVRPEQLP